MSAGRWDPMYSRNGSTSTASTPTYCWRAITRTECYCSSERLDEVRKAQQARKEPPRYDRHCRDLTAEQRADAEASGVTPVVRFKTPLTGETRTLDALRGEVVFQNSTLDDFVMLKSDGYPTYHLAAMVDDHLMGITHVLRDESWLPSAPRHFLIYQAFGWEPPIFAHVSRVLGSDKAKLSKRHGAHSVLEYRDQGYLPEARGELPRASRLVAGRPHRHHVASRP